MDPADTDDVARGLLEALDDHAGYSERGRARVEQKYTWKATAARYLQVIESGAAAGPRVLDAVPTLDYSNGIAEHLRARADR